ncbi:UNVERIFIED_CONTAM: hypothetical protein RMT77_012985 [Armadillidium vulgare]
MIVNNSNTDNIILIINSSLINSKVMEYLGTGYRKRRSENTPKDSIILPQSKVAILLIFVDDLEISKKLNKEDFDREEPEWVTGREEEGEEEIRKGNATLESYQDLLERLEKFYKNHQKAVVILVNNSFGATALEFVSELTLHFAPFSPEFLLAHGDAQTASIIRSLAKATHIETKKLIGKRISKILEGTSSKQSFELKFSDQCEPLTNLCRSDLTTLSSSSAEEIAEKYGIDLQTSQKIFNFFNAVVN